MRGPVGRCGPFPGCAVAALACGAAEVPDSRVAFCNQNIEYCFLFVVTVGITGIYDAGFRARLATLPTIRSACLPALSILHLMLSIFPINKWLAILCSGDPCMVGHETTQNSRNDFTGITTQGKLRIPEPVLSLLSLVPQALGMW